MKPLEPGCLALMTAGDNCGTVVTCLEKISPPKLVNVRYRGVVQHDVPLVVSDTDTDGLVWAVSGNIKANCGYRGDNVIEIYTGNLACNGLYPSKWLMRIDDDSDVKEESNPYAQTRQNATEKKKPIVPLIFSKFGPTRYYPR